MSNSAPVTPFAGSPNIASASKKGARAFRPCGQTGSFGPSQAQCDTAYRGTELDGEVIVDHGVQIWRAPASGCYSIEAIGARGGNKAPGEGGFGARIVGDFDLKSGDELRIHVGQKGCDFPGTSSTQGAGGGGGSFVFLNGKAILIAGGGGGTSYQNDSGSGGSASSFSIGGGYGTANDGQGGGSDDGGGGGTGGGGGGLYSAGKGNRWTKGGAAAGGQGGGDSKTLFGGFGGGGDAYHGGGGGGGYTGGGGGLYKVGGGGGGSLNTGLNQNNTANFGSDDGMVMVRRK